MGRTTFFLLEQKRKQKDKQKEKKAEQPNIVGFNELNAKDSQEAISNINDLDRLNKLLEIEKEDEPRKTVVRPLEAKIAELQKEE